MKGDSSQEQGTGIVAGFGGIKNVFLGPKPAGMILSQRMTRESSPSPGVSGEALIFQLIPFFKAGPWPGVKPGRFVFCRPGNMAGRSF